MIFYIIILIGLLIFSALFSASETAFFSLSTLDILKLKNSTSNLNNIICKLLQYPKKLLITILFGNTLVNILFFSVSTGLSNILKENYGDKIYSIISIASLSAVILGGEVIPKAIASKVPLTISKLSCIIILIFYNIFSFFTQLLEKFTNLLCKKIENSKNSFITTDELKYLFNFLEKEKIINPIESDMLLDVIELKDIKVKDIMVPRVEMVKCSISSSRNFITNLLSKTKVTKLPIHNEKDEDEIIGIIYAKEFFLNPDKSIKDIIHNDIIFVPENLNLENLLRKFFEKRETIAIVLDEYGGVEGLVTLEDIIEEIVGEINDEYDKEEPLIKRISPFHYHISGDLSIKELKEFFKTSNIKSRNFSTLGGWITYNLQKLPCKGDKLYYNNLSIEVLEVYKNRIKKVCIKIENKDEKEKEKKTT